MSEDTLLLRFMKQVGALYGFKVEEIMSGMPKHLVDIFQKLEESRDWIIERETHNEQYPGPFFDPFYDQNIYDIPEVEFYGGNRAEFNLITRDVSVCLVDFDDELGFIFNYVATKQYILQGTPGCCEKYCKLYDDYDADDTDKRFLFRGCLECGFNGYDYHIHEIDDIYKMTLICEQCLREQRVKAFEATYYAKILPQDVCNIIVNFI